MDNEATKTNTNTQSEKDKKEEDKTPNPVEGLPADAPWGGVVGDNNIVKQPGA
jgi:hypothetical protein